MSEPIADLERAVSAFLVKECALTSDSIRERITQFRVMFSVTDEQAESLARTLEERHEVSMAIGSVLQEHDFKPWLENASAGIDFYYWERYRTLLAEKKLSNQVISTMHADTERTLGFLGNPQEPGPWSRRGMVVGHVQSGKTANYVGLISKAADAGYRLIVVIAGIHNNLRNQTQKRIDEGFVGRDSARLLSQREERQIGVGRINALRRPVTFTNSIKDFSKQMATGVGVQIRNLREPAVFVIKKNSSTLKNLLEWLREHNAAHGGGTIDEPMLLIDDEADNASINVAYSKDEVSRINRQIRELLQMFNRSCYVGYTATPFANIFIDPTTDDEMIGQDLFPRDFIVSLDPPSNYFGADRVFLDETSRAVRHVKDNEDLLPVRHKIDHQISALPPSLKEAIRTFVLARAIRLHRGQAGTHCSMLVNASRFTRVQGQLRAAIARFVEDIVAAVRLSGALSSSEALLDPEVSALKTTCEREYPDVGVQWPALQRLLLEAAAPIKVVEVNSASSGSLNYDDYEGTGLNVIAVGGYALSRGLTLEGLMISYFLRNSMMYDTLMQMGRWFGYRPGYEDLCRVWMSEEAEGWYQHIAEAIEMLRGELRDMAAAGATPEQFGLKVRAHPDTLIVTARNKMGAGEKIVVSIGLDNKLIETHTIRDDEASLVQNRRALTQLAVAMAEAGRSFADAEENGGSRLVRDVPVALVTQFIKSYMNSPLSLLTESGPVVRYIEGRADGELALWDVNLIGLDKRSSSSLVDTSSGVPVVCQQRTTKKAGTGNLRLSTRQRVASRGAERVGLSHDEQEIAEAEYKRGKPDGQNIPDWAYRLHRSRPLLMLHPIEALDGEKKEQNAVADGEQYRMHQEPVVAWGISFPKTGTPEERVEYVVTATWVRENFGGDEAEEAGDND